MPVLCTLGHHSEANLKLLDPYGALEPLLNSWPGLIYPLLTWAQPAGGKAIKALREELWPFHKLLMNFQVCLLAADSGDFLRPPTG